MKEIPQSELVKLLTTLSAQDRKDLKQFVQSPYFKKSSTYYKLLDYLDKSFPELSPVRLKPERVFNHVWPKEAYNEKKLGRTLSDFRALVLQFLSFQELKQDDGLQQQLLIRAFGRRNQYRYMGEYQDIYLKSLDGAAFKDAAYHWAHFEAHYNSYFHPDAKKFANLADTVQQLGHHFDRFYILKSLRCAAEMKVRELIFGERYELPLLENVLNLADELYQGKNPVVEVYSNIIRLCHLKVDSPDFEKTIRSFKDHFELFEKQEQGGVLSLLMNYAYHLFNKGENKYIQEVLRLYQFGLEKGLLVQNGHIPTSTFLNIAITAAIAKEFPYAEDFIQNHGPMLKPELKQDTMDLSQAFVLFHQHKYKDANRLLGKIKKNNWRFYLYVKTLKLRCDYELLGTDKSPLENQIEAFRKWIYKNQNGSNRESYLAFCRIMTKLIKNYAHQEISEVKENLHRDIASGEQLALRGWLSEKVDELMP